MEPMLFSPLKIRDVTLRNRIVVSPMLTYSAQGGHVNDWHLAHLAQFAAGGAGLVFMESTKIDPAGCSTPRDTGLWKDDFIEPLKRITALIKRNGAVPAHPARPLGTQGAQVACRGKGACRWRRVPAWTTARYGSWWARARFRTIRNMRCRAR